MKPCLLFFAAVFGMLPAAPAAGAKPNVLLIYSDDHGWADLALQGADPDVRTPNLDQLARDGVRFERGYVSAPQCVPSRAGVISGTYQSRFGVEDNNKGPLPLDVLTLPERLKKAGYVTGMSGKWHLDLGGKGGGKGGGEKAQRIQPAFLPHAHGFDEYWCGSMRQYHASHDLKSTPFADAPHLVSDDRFRVTVQTEAAVSFLDRRAAAPGQPWFLYLAWFAPHVPLESPEPWFSKTPAHLPKERRQALAMIAAMDDGLGAIRARLKTMGADKDTLIFFIGDNGAPTGRGAWNGSLNTPLIGEKGMLTDGGVRVPFVAAWPGKIPAGSTFPHPVINLDVAATAVALAGLPHDAQLDGVDLMPSLLGQGSAPPHEALYWRWRSQAAVLEFPWKLIHLGSKERFLFDVTRPDGETKNLLAEHPDVAARLEAKWQAWSAGLKPPGPPEAFNEQDLNFYVNHVDSRLGDGKTPRSGARKTPETEAGGIQGWLCRNGSMEVKGDALVITPERKGKGRAGAQVFLARAGLSVPGPVTATLRLRASQGGASRLSWRSDGDKDFLPASTAAFDWPASAEWQTVQVRLPAEGRLIHLRLSPGPGSQGLELRSIDLQGAGGPPVRWDFAPSQK